MRTRLSGSATNRQPAGAVNVAPFAVVSGVSADRSCPSGDATWAVAGWAPASAAIKKARPTMPVRMRLLHGKECVVHIVALRIVAYTLRRRQVGALSPPEREVVGGMVGLRHPQL